MNNKIYCDKCNRNKCINNCTISVPEYIKTYNLTNKSDDEIISHINYNKNIYSYYAREENNINMSRHWSFITKYETSKLYYDLIPYDYTTHRVNRLFESNILFIICREMNANNNCIHYRNKIDNIKKIFSYLISLFTFKKNNKKEKIERIEQIKSLVGKYKNKLSSSDNFLDREHIENSGEIFLAAIKDKCNQCIDKECTECGLSDIINKYK